MTISALAAGICVSAGVVHGVSVTLALRRCTRRGAHLPPPEVAPPVSIVQPLCGMETFSRETLRSIFDLDYPNYEIVFCLANADDPIEPLVRGAIAARPDRPARLLIGDDRVSANPKLNNVVKGFKAARHEWLVMADSNVLMPRDYIQRLLARWTAGTGIVCAPPIGSMPETFGAEIECAFLNTYEARWQYAAEAAGFGFAQGKTMLWRRDILEAGGGIEALGAEIAEDAASTKLVHRQGLSAHLVNEPFQQPLGARKLKDVWGRQLRWARLRRATFPAHFAPEILTTSLVLIVAAAFAAPEFGSSPWVSAFLAAVFWYALEALLAFVAGWPLGWLSPPAWIARDLLLPLLWAEGWRGDSFVWRGNAMSVDERALREAPEGSPPQM
ncbi:ceramide glucosyltransferase [Roseiarcus fermentans]|uniref:Ceramide glucosyltransferase n=1 Tax=Roseiarcus fermentans TaxID=1473586 RepID=A0A366FNC2_9HYPH|nr:ceramide glucosyltransferase [Roseiarcus fermentans]RBP16132.1 ceramide glucosyltransferase [Roseiarcus fermentans]